MVTLAKQRIQVSLSAEARRVVPGLARKLRIPTATLASELIDTALELKEDRAFAKIADQRLASKNVLWISHNAIWKKHLGKSSTTRK